MHGVVDVGAHGAIPSQQLVDLRSYCPAQRIGRHRIRIVAVEHPRQLRCMPRRCGSGVEQPGAQPVQQLSLCDRVGSGKFEFPFAPPLFGAGIARPSGDAVITELGQRLAVGVGQ